MKTLLRIVDIACIVIMPKYQEVLHLSNNITRYSNINNKHTLAYLPTCLLGQEEAWISFNRIDLRCSFDSEFVPFNYRRILGCIPSPAPIPTNHVAVHLENHYLPASLSLSQSQITFHYSINLILRTFTHSIFTT